MQEKYYEAIKLLAELAGNHGANTYSIKNCALGLIPFKNGENKANEVGIGFSEVARWLIDEGEKNFEASLKEE